MKNQSSNRNQGKLANQLFADRQLTPAQLPAYPERLAGVKHSSKLNGYSIVELMIVITLGLIIIAGIMRFYMSNKTVQTMQTEVSQMQTDARFSMELLSRELRMAGSGMGQTMANLNNISASKNLFKNHVVNGPASLNRLTAISGWEANGTAPGDQDSNTPSQPFDLYTSQITGRTASDWTPGGNPVDINTNLAIPNSDILTMTYSVNVDAIATSGDATSLTLSSVSNVKAGDYIALSDGSFLDIVVACSVDDGNNTVSLNDTTSANSVCGNNPGDLQNDGNVLISHFSNFVAVGKLISNTYFVGKPAGGANNSQDLTPALYKISNGSAAQQVIEGVESMQVLLDGKPISSYSTAAMMGRVKTINLSFLMSTEDKLSQISTQRTFDLNGYLVSPKKDRRIRRVYNTTIALRSQIGIFASN